MAKDQRASSSAAAKSGENSPALKLREILDGVATAAIAGSLDTEIRAIACDSRKAHPAHYFSRCLARKPMAIDSWPMRSSAEQ